MANGSRVKKNRGTNNLYEVLKADKTLYRITGTKKATRAQYVKRTWKYIKKNNLQDPHDGRFIIPDEKLATLMGHAGQRINGFTMMHYIEAHLVKS